MVPSAGSCALISQASAWPGWEPACPSPTPSFRLAARPGGISTAVAIHSLEPGAIVVRCRLMKGGAVLEVAEIPLEANGQEAQFIEEIFTTTDTSDFVGSVHCTGPQLDQASFTGVGRGAGCRQPHLYHTAGGACDLGR